MTFEQFMILAIFIMIVLTNVRIDLQGKMIDALSDLVIIARKKDL